MFAMKISTVLLVLLGLGEASLKQDPCAGCNEDSAIKYQACAKNFGNPCAETNKAGLVIAGEGIKKDVGCCMAKQKHDRCLQCTTLDCSYQTCSKHVNKKYYRERTIEPKDPNWDKKAMKAAGWHK